MYLNWHPVALKVQVDDVPDLLCCTMLAGHHDVQQTARWIHLQSLAHSGCQATRLGWPPILLQDTTPFKSHSTTQFCPITWACKPNQLQLIRTLILLHSSSIKKQPPTGLLCKALHVCRIQHDAKRLHQELTAKSCVKCVCISMIPQPLQ